MRNTIFLAASANVAVGLLALFLHVVAVHREVDSISAVRRRASKKRKAKVPQIAKALPDDKDHRTLVVLIAVAMAGFCSLSLQVLWTRVLVFVLETSAYAFACVLTCFIFGIALGSLLCSRLLLAKIKRPVLALGMIEFMVGLFALASVPLLGMLGQIDYVLTRSGPDAANNTEASGIRPVVGPR